MLVFNTLLPNVSFFHPLKIISQNIIWPHKKEIKVTHSLHIANLKKSELYAAFIFCKYYLFGQGNKNIDWKVNKIERNDVCFQKSFDSFCYLHEEPCKMTFVWVTVCVMALPIFNFGILNF